VTPLIRKPWRRLHLACETSAETARDIVRALSGAPTPSPRLLGIDGRSGSGKSRLARRVCQALDEVGLSRTLVVMDDLYEGWAGLPQAPSTLCSRVIDPLSAGGRAAYRRFDWHVGALTDTVEVTDAEVIVIEGVGSTWHRRREAFTLTVWVQAPAEVRHERACARTGQGDFAAQGQAWARAEDALFGPDGYPHPPAPFDMVLDTRLDREGCRD